MSDSSPVSVVVGASSGIGRSLACALARDRQRVALIGRRLEMLERVAREVKAFGGEPFVFVSDVTDRDSVRRALDTILAHWNRIDTAFLSAGIGQNVDPQQFSTQPLTEIMDINVIGVANWLEALLPVMTAQEHGGTIAVISSLSADRAFPGAGSAYSASKAAISQLCDGLRAPWAQQGVRLVTVEPGFIRTPMTEHLSWTPMMIESQEAARAILDGLQRGHSVIRFPKLASIGMGLLRNLPASLLDRLYRK